MELGSGFATKTGVLLSGLRQAGSLRRFVPLDVSAPTVEHCAKEVASRFEVPVHGIVGDFERDVELIPDPIGPRIVAMLGSTIGNLPPGSRRHFLSRLRDLLDPDGWLLLGVDLVKDPEIIEQAYNDSAGVAAAFSHNVLTVINRELDADFAIDDYEHVAFYDPDQEWVDIRLRATNAYVVHLDLLDLAVDIRAGEDIRTEISSKFSVQRLKRDLHAAGLVLEELFTDEHHLFGVALGRADTDARP